MENFSQSIANVIDNLKIIPEPFSVDGIINTFSSSIENEKLIKSFAIYFSKNDVASLWYKSNKYKTEYANILDVENVINNKLVIKIDNIQIYPLIARDICFGALVIEASKHIFKSKRFSFLIDYFSLILYTEKLSFQANKDKLTSLYNRGYILMLLNKYQKEDKDYSIIIMDLDKFKHYNDKYGHNTGDHILKLACVKMKECLKEQPVNTTLARYGGEEFIVLVDTHSKHLLINIMESLRKVIEATDFSTENFALKATMSLGGSLSIKGKDVNDIIELADKALYTSKNSGRNRASIS